MRNLILSVYYKAEIFHKDGNLSGNFGAKGSHDMNLRGKFVTIDIFEFLNTFYGSYSKHEWERKISRKYRQYQYSSMGTLS